MNAYDLASELEINAAFPLDDRHRGANMLRQQADRILELEVNLKAQVKLAYAQAERIESLLTMADGFQSLINHQAEHIAELEKDLHMVQRHNDQLDHDLPNAEPVAWIRADGTVDFAPNKLFTAGQPFYTTPQTKPHPKCDEACMYLCQFSDIDKEKLIAIFLESFALGHRCGRVGDDVTKRFNEIEDEFRSILKKTDESSAPQTKPLSDEEIKECKLKSWQQCKDTTEIIDFELSYQDELFARAIEERHGIK